MKKKFKFNHFKVKTDLKKVKEKWVVASVALFSFISVLNSKNSLNSFLKTVHADISDHHYKRKNSTNQGSTTDLITLSSSRPKISGAYKPITPPMANVKISDYDDQYSNKRRQLGSEAAFNVKKNHSLEVKPIDSKSSNGLLDSLVANIVEQVKTGKDATVSASSSSNSNDRPNSFQPSDSNKFESKSLNHKSSESIKASEKDNYAKIRADLFDTSDSFLKNKTNSGQEENHRRLSINPNRQKLKRKVIKEENLSRPAVEKKAVKPLNSEVMNSKKSAVDTSDQSVTSSNNPEFVKSMSSISKSIANRAVEANSLASLDTSLAILKTSSFDSDVQTINSLVKMASSNMVAMDDSINQFNSYSNESNPVNADDISKNSDISDMLNEIKNRANVSLEPISSLSDFVNTSQSVADGYRNDAMKNINQIRKNTELIQSNASDAIANFANGNNDEGFKFQRSAQSLMNDVNSYSSLISQATKAIENNSFPLNDKRSSLNSVMVELSSYASLAQSTVSEILTKSGENDGNEIVFHHNHEVNNLNLNSSSASETVIAKPAVAKPTSSHRSFNFRSTSLFNSGSMSLIKSANINSTESSNNVSATSTSQSNQSDKQEVTDDEDKKAANSLINYFRKPKYVYIMDSVQVYGNIELSDDEVVDSYKVTDLKNSPIFKVVGEGINKHGDKVYEVANNHFISARLELNDLYYSPSSDYHNVEIIKSMGIKAHKKIDFSDVGRRITVGTKLQTNRIINYGNGTRFVLTSGEYITTNKKFVKII